MLVVTLTGGERETSTRRWTAGRMATSRSGDEMTKAAEILGVEHTGFVTWLPMW